MVNDFILDCSMTISWFFENEKDTSSLKVMDLLKKSRAIVPAIWPYEITNVLTVSEKRLKLPQQECYKILRQILSLPIEIEAQPDAVTLQAILSLSCQYRLSAYDAAYLESAIRLGMPLATKDKELIHAAKKCKVATL